MENKIQKSGSSGKKNPYTNSFSEWQRGNGITETQKCVQTNTPRSVILNSQTIRSPPPVSSLPNLSKPTVEKNKVMVIDKSIKKPIKEPPTRKLTNKSVTNQPSTNKPPSNKKSTSITVENTRSFRDISNQLTTVSSNLFIDNVIHEKEKLLSEAIKKNTILQNNLKCREEVIKKLRSENSNLVKRLKELETVIAEDKKNLDIITLELEKIKNINYEWQENSLNKCDLISKMFINMSQILKDNETNEFRAPTGHEYSGQIHLGRGAWLPKQTYLLASNNINLSTKKKFVRNILVAIFGYDVLAASTVTGRASNRNKDDKKPKALEPAKLLAVKDIYRYFLINNLRMTAEDAEMESDQTNRYVTKKIAQVKEIYQKAPKIGKQFLGNNTESEENHSLQDAEYSDRSEPDHQSDTNDPLEYVDQSNIDDLAQPDDESGMDDSQQTDDQSDMDESQQPDNKSDMDESQQPDNQSDMDESHQPDNQSDMDDSLHSVKQSDADDYVQSESDIDGNILENIVEANIIQIPENLSERKKEVLDKLLSSDLKYE